MIKRLSILLIAVMLLPAFIIAQEHTVLSADGKIIKHKGDLKTLEIVSAKKNKSLAPIFVEKFSKSPSSILGPSSTLTTFDTLTPPGPWETNAFIQYGQDVMLQWYVAPADLYIHKVGFACKDNEVFTQSVEVKVVKVNLTLDQIKNAAVARRGYYEATGNGYNDITAFMDNPDVTGPWVSIDGSPEPFGNDLWSDAGIGWTVVGITNQPDPYTYQWVDLSVLALPDIKAGEIFGIAIKELETVIGAGDGVSYWYGDMDLGGWKFYADGRLTTQDYGWWSREYTWDFVAEVELYSDRAPVINSFTVLNSGLDVGPFTVDADITDDNPADPTQAGVASAKLFWSIDAGTTWNEVTMTGTEPAFTGVIPAQEGGKTVQYYITAEDVNANSVTSSTKSFYIFAPTPGVKSLVVFNGYTVVTGYPRAYYFGSGNWPANYTTFQFDRDRWAYGALTAELVNNYDNIYEICTDGPNDINSDVIRTWLEGAGNRNYMLAGDEWLGAQSGWTDGPHAAGEFIFDILGINYEYNDINYSATGDQNLPSEVYPQSGTLLGGNLLDLYNKVSTDSGWTSPMVYDPYYEISIANWLDGVDFESDVEVDMMGKPKSGANKVIGGHRTLPAGNKIAFFAFDPLSLDSDHALEYFWYGFMDVAPQVEALKWFGYTVDVKRENDLIPDSYKLSQNFPNPFNPSTTIKFAIPQTSNVVLKIYDVLGKEVATLLNGEKAAGNYEVNFDASQFASGMYIYTIQAGSFSTSKKMMLMK